MLFRSVPGKAFHPQREWVKLSVDISLDPQRKRVGTAYTSPCRTSGLSLRGQDSNPMPPLVVPPGAPMHGEYAIAHIRGMNPDAPGFVPWQGAP